MRLVEDIQNILIADLELTLRGAMEVIDKGGLQLAILVNPDKSLRGVISDGDVRRALLAGASLNELAEPFINGDPVCCPENSLLAARNAAASAGVSKVVYGVVGQAPRGVFIVDFGQDPLKLPPVFIMAGGKGLRLRPLTETKPKPLIEIGGIPILHRILGLLADNGFREVYMSVNYLGQQIKESVGDGSVFGLNIKYVVEESPMGTAGSIGLISKSESPELLIVMNADLVLDLDFVQLVSEHIEEKNDFTVVVRENTTHIPFGVIKILDNRVIGVDEKPTYTDLVSAGIYCLSKSVISTISSTPQDMPELMNSTIASGLKVGAFPIHKNWIDIGSHSDLKRAQDTIKDQR